MCDVQNNVRFTWQLLSEFVSWEFCRYVFEQSENNAPETDVLTFLRNMIVQRTEKSVSNITKHEIVAKFIMETKAIQNISRMPCIAALSESVKRICPELEPAVTKLVYHLETFLNVLDSTDECRQELIQIRISDAIKDFSKEAQNHLPLPDLLQVIESWNHHHAHSPQKPVKKVIYNAMLYEKVLECLHFETITPSEAKLISVALHQDKVFENIFLHAEAELTETEADSEQFSLSLQSSQLNEHMYSQEFGKTVEIQKNNVSANAKPSQLSAPSLEVPDEFPGVPDEACEEPPQLSPVQVPVVSPPIQSSPVNDVICRDICDPNSNLEIQNNMSDSNMQFAQSSSNESPSRELNCTLHDRIHKKIEIINYQRTQNQSDSDTSDCDKNPQYKILTPTIYKTGTQKSAPPKSQVIWLSDDDSNDSSIITTAVNSQQDDPNWSTRQRKRARAKNEGPTVKTRHMTQTQVLCSSDSDSNDSSIINSQQDDLSLSTKLRKRAPARSEGPTVKTRHMTQTQVLCSSDSDSNDSSHMISVRNVPSCSTREKTTAVLPSTIQTRNKIIPSRKKVVRVLDSSDSNESIHNSLIENEGNLLHRLQQLPSTSVTLTEAELERPTKKRRVEKKKLYRSPNVSLEDFTVQTRKPVPVVTSEVPVHRETQTTKRKKPSKSGKTVVKKLNCKQCNKVFKTVLALRRHVFLKHTQPPDDSDCDS